MALTVDNYDEYFNDVRHTMYSCIHTLHCMLHPTQCTAANQSDIIIHSGDTTHDITVQQQALTIQHCEITQATLY